MPEAETNQLNSALFISSIHFPKPQTMPVMQMQATLKKWTLLQVKSRKIEVFISAIRKHWYCNLNISPKLDLGGEARRHLQRSTVSLVQRLSMFFCRLRTKNETQEEKKFFPTIPCYFTKEVFYSMLPCDSETNNFLRYLNPLQEWKSTLVYSVIVEILLDFEILPLGTSLDHAETLHQVLDPLDHF